MGELTPVGDRAPRSTRVTGRQLDRRVIGLPPREFLYTLDQIAVLVEMPQHELMTEHVYFDGKSEGSPRRYPRCFMARDIAPAGAGRPDWRVTETELIRWFKKMGFRYYEVGYCKS